MIGQKASRSMSKKVKYINCSYVLDQALAMNLKTLISSINTETQPRIR